MKNSISRSIYISLLCFFAAISTNAQKPELVLQSGLTNAVETVAFSPDGRAVVTSTHGGASCSKSISTQLWDARNGALIRTIAGEEFLPPSFQVVSPNGLSFAAAGWELYVWNSKTGKLLWKRKEETKNVAFSPDSKFIFSFTGRFIKVWDAARGTLVSNLTMADSAAFAPTGRYIVTELNKKISE